MFYFSKLLHKILVLFCIIHVIKLSRLETINKYENCQQNILSHADVSQMTITEVQQVWTYIYRGTVIQDFRHWLFTVCIILLLRRKDHPYYMTTLMLQIWWSFSGELLF